MNKTIVIKDWIGNVLLKSDYDSKELDKFLDDNRCECLNCNNDHCPDCEETGYKNEFFAEWDDPENQDNVYEWINY